MNEKVYIVTKDVAYEFDSDITIEIVTKDKKLAQEKFDELKKEIKKITQRKGFVFVNGKYSVECYPEGYASQEHYYIRMYEETLS